MDTCTAMFSSMFQPNCLDCDMHTNICQVCLQEMWESMGVVWEWTWYSQTVHAYTEPDLVGANAGTVSLPFHQCLGFRVPLHLHQVGHGHVSCVRQALLKCLSSVKLGSHTRCESLTPCITMITLYHCHVTTQCKVCGTVICSHTAYQKCLHGLP